jgi:hypothetical protein
MMIFNNCNVEIDTNASVIEIKPGGADEWIRIKISANGVEEGNKLKQVVANAEAGESGHDSFTAQVEIAIRNEYPK